MNDPSLNVYCEDGAIRVLSGIPLEDFRDQYNSPVTAEAFLRSLRDNQIRILVYKDLPGSRLKEIIRQMKAGRLDVRRNGITLEEITARPRQKTGEAVVIYRVHSDAVA